MQRCPDALPRGLRAEGAGTTCVLVASDDSLDGRELALEGALRAVVGSDDGASISCVPGRLAVLSSEAPNKTTTILRRATDGSTLPRSD